jgi:CheY-like chemotaxis protein
VFGIVKQAGGHIEVESKEQVGSCFRVYLPRARPAPADDREQLPLITPPPRGETILVVEDEDVVLRRTAGMLERAGYVVVAAGGPDEAAELHGRSPGNFDLLLTDVIMPKASGPELASRLRQKDPKLRVLLMSGYTDEHVSRQGPAWHGAPILEKPFDGPKLLAAVGAALALAPPPPAGSPDEARS